MSGSTSQKSTRLRNYYLALDLAPGVSHNEILHAYNRSKMTYTNGSLASYSVLDGETNNSILAEIEEAFAVLGNPAKRREYDMTMGYSVWNDEEASAQAPGPANVLPTAITTLKHVSKPATEAASTTFQGGGAAFAETPTTPDGDRSVASATGTKPWLAAVSGRRVETDTVSAKNFENFEANPEFEKQIRDCKEVDGAFLKAVRIYRKLGLDQLALRCKLSSSHIATIENEDGATMAQPVYLRGHVYLIAQALDLPDPQTLATGFVARMRQTGKLPKGPF